MKTTPLLAALLMLGGVGSAYAQDRPSEGRSSASERGSSAAQERGPGSDAGVSKRSEAGEQSPDADGKNADAPRGRSAEKSDRQNNKSNAGRASEEGSGEKSSRSAEKSGSDDASGSKHVGHDGSDTSSKSATTKNTSASDKTDRSVTDTSTSDRSAENKPSGARAKHVDLTGDKRTKVQTALRDSGGNVKHRTNVDIHITVGRRLPRDWDYVRVPSPVIAIVPEYRDYYFAYVGDEYIIVEPDTYEVVAVLPAESSRASASSGREAASGQCSAQLSLSRQERELILDNVRGGREADVSEISVGRDVPKGVELRRFPDSVIAEAKVLEGCRYFDAGGEIAIVDPNGEKIVLIIDKS